MKVLLKIHQVRGSKLPTLRVQKHLIAAFRVGVVMLGLLIVNVDLNLWVDLKHLTALSPVAQFAGQMLIPCWYV